MNAQKTAIPIPRELVTVIDDAKEKRRLSSWKR